METIVGTIRRPVKRRRHDIDWLRVLAFGLLILFHVSLFFSHWGWHIKNNEISYRLNYPILFTTQWRMPLLFMISGAGVYWSLGKRSAATFIRDRTRRILLPLVFGMLVIIPQQIYLERLMQGHTYDYFTFYRHMFTGQLYPTGDFGWHHLWYLAYIFLYSLLGLPLLLLLRRPSGERLMARLVDFFRNPRWLLLVPVGWFLLGDALHLPENERGLLGDWKWHFRYFTLFVAGFVLCGQPRFWETLRRYRHGLLALAVGLMLVLLFFFWRNWRVFSGLEAVSFEVLRTAHYWVWLLAIFAYGYTYLDFSNRFLRYASPAVYPFYILHQTFLITAGYYLAPLPWPWPVKFLLIVIATFGGCWLAYHFLIRPYRFVRPFFGVS